MTLAPFSFLVVVLSMIDPGSGNDPGVASTATVDKAIPAAKPSPVLESIVVRGREATPAVASIETRHALTLEQIDALGATSAAQIVRRLPSVHVPTNSRGESIAFMRNAGERQVAIFYEGAAINVPWDNRLDLDLVPAGLVGGVLTAAGPLAPHYGVNALGALSLSPRGSGDGAQWRLAAGSGGLADTQVFLPLHAGSFDFEVGASYADRRGDALSGNANLPFSQAGDELRTNTDGRLASVFGHSSVQLGGNNVSLTAFHVEGSKGIAPESDRARGARFWRYPEVRHTLVAADVVTDFGAGGSLDSALWFQDFGQTIDSYTDATYDDIGARQVDEDRTAGLRELWKHERGPLTWIGSFNFLDSRHRQLDIGYVAGNPPQALPDALRYSQRNWSVGGELGWALTSRLKAELGAGVDNVDYRDTGDKPPIDDVQGWTGRAGLVFDAGDGWHLRAALGRKLRAPTMRELFGQALRRFLINPDLKPERIVSAELGAAWEGRSGNLFVIPFVQDLEDTIDQRNVGSLRQRINLEGSRVRGLEAGGEWWIDGRWRLAGSVTWSDVARKGVLPGQSDKIAERPELLAQFLAEYRHPSGFTTAFEAEHVGQAYSLDAAGALVPLARSTSFNWRAGYAFSGTTRRGELFVHVDNLTDVLVEPQLGLPAPGREVRIGITVN